MTSKCVIQWNCLDNDFKMCHPMKLMVEWF